MILVHILFINLNSLIYPYEILSVEVIGKMLTNIMTLNIQPYMNSHLIKSAPSIRIIRDLYHKSLGQKFDILYVSLLALLPYITLFDTEAEMYNIYLLNISIGFATIYACVVSWHRKYNLTISYLDLALISFISISFLSAFINNKPTHKYLYLNFYCVCFLIISIKSIVLPYISLLHKTLIFSIISLAIIISLLYMTADIGTFLVIINNKTGNTGICAIFLAIAICTMLFAIKHTKSPNKRLLFVILLLSCLYIIIQLRCRTAAVVIAAFCLLETFRIKNLYNFQSARKKNLMTFYIIALFMIGYCIIISSNDITKANSQIGRLFILRNIITLFHDCPLIGHGGFGSFPVSYASCQSEWFSSHCNLSLEDNRILLADNIMYANNEYLQFLCETGLCGIIALTILIRYSITSLRKDNFVLYSIPVPLLIAAAFYYVMHVSIFCSIALIICIIASCRCSRKTTITSKCHVLYCILLFCGVYVTIYNIEHYRFSKKIHHTLIHTNISYAQAMNVLDQYGENHALMALLANRYTDSTNEIYDNIELNFIHSDMLWAEGRNLIRIGNDSVGEQKLLLATYIVPNRFRYNHELLQLYKRRGDTLKCLIFAHKILRMPVKIPSPIVTAIKMEANEFLNDLQPFQNIPIDSLSPTPTFISIH